MFSIAIVDDHLPTIERLNEYFKTKWNASVLYAHENGYDFLRALTQKKQIPDLILTDINMPIIDGISLTHFIKLNYPSVKIICTSVFDEPKLLKTAFASGVDAYILKAAIEMHFHFAWEAIQKNEIFIDHFAVIGMEDILPYNEKSKIMLSPNQPYNLTLAERIFIILSSTRKLLSFEQIAELMQVDTATIESYFKVVKNKLAISTRDDLEFFSLKKGLTLNTMPYAVA